MPLVTTIFSEKSALEKGIESITQAVKEDYAENYVTALEVV